MPDLVITMIASVFRALRSRRDLVLENLALRHQLAVLNRTAKHQRLFEFRSPLLGLALPLVALLEGHHRDRQTGDGHPLASSCVQSILDTTEQEVQTGSPTHQPRHARSDPKDKHREPTLGCTSNPRRDCEAWH